MKYIDADRLKAEIERQEKQCPLDTYEGRHRLFILGGLKTFLSTLESEKPIEQDGLKEEIESYWKENGPMSHAEYDRLAKCARHFAQWGAEWKAKQDQETIELAEDHAYFAGAVNEREKMMKEAVEGWVAVDSDTNGKRRVTFFPGKPVRDVLTEYKYWAATRPGYESIKLDSNAFPELKWEDEPKKVRIIIIKDDEKSN